VSSANQRPVDSTYPYYIPGGYDVYRGLEINRKLSEMNSITPQDMMRLHNDNFNPFAEVMVKLMKKYTNTNGLSSEEKLYYDMLINWNLMNDANSKAATVFQLWFEKLEMKVWKDEFTKNDSNLYLLPSDFTLADAITKDSTFVFIDDITTPQKETVYDLFTASFKETVPDMVKAEKENKLEWGVYKNTTVYHILRNAVMPFARAGLMTGGGKHIVNATQHSHGPSWRMIVHLTNETEAYVVYPGGQSGNPGSKYYSSFIDTWTKGDYYRAWFMKKTELSNPNIKWVMDFKKG
jgi:penicillin amidase